MDECSGWLKVQIVYFKAI